MKKKSKISGNVAVIIPQTLPAMSGSQREKRREETFRRFVSFSFLALAVGPQSARRSFLQIAKSKVILSRAVANAILVFSDCGNLLGVLIKAI